MVYASATTWRAFLPAPYNNIASLPLWQRVTYSYENRVPILCELLAIDMRGQPSVAEQC